jgi:signal transduction histidine kinase/HAMP domain-containing protein
MDFLNKMTIKARMVLSFALILLFFIVFTLFSITEMGQLGGLTETLYEHPLRVSNAALEAKVGIIRMHRSMKEVSKSRTETALHTIIVKVQSDEKLVYRNLGIVKRRILGQEGKKLVHEAMELFANWKPIRVAVQELTLKGNHEDAARITGTTGADLVLRLEEKMSELTAYAIHKADGFMGEARDVQRRVLRNTGIFIGAAILLSLVIAFFVTKSILTNVSALKETMGEVTRTGDLIKSELSGKNEISNMAKDFNRLVDRLQEQFWLKDGQNSLRDEMAGDLSYEDLVIKCTHFISRYVGACAGALYTFNEKDSSCELLATYAFVEGKHFAHGFAPGEGIVGQVAVEKEPILLNGINEKDHLVQTGTIDAPPKSIYAVPLLYDRRLYGVLEIATFEELSPLNIEFMDLISPVISARMHNTLQEEQIKYLLKSEQEKNEALQAQAEELRAQTEELHSQAEELRVTSEELQEQNAELTLQRRQVEEANRLKSEFLSNMSHELRTPLNSVMALSRVLASQAKEKLNEEELDYLAVISRNGKKLLSLINDLLDLAKIESGRMDVHSKPFSLSSAIETVIERLDVIAREKEIEIRNDVPDNLPRIDSDETRVDQILQNLIGNAVKFTEEGHVTISAHVDGEKLRIRISDTGIGISEKDVPYIFDEFRQVDGTTARHYEGTGLGLAIAFKATRMLGGDLSVESVPGKGSTFTLTLPIKWPKIFVASDPFDGRPSETMSAEQLTLFADEHSRKPYSSAPEPIAPKRVLVVEDNQTAMLQIRTFLESEGYLVDTAGGGQEAIDYVNDTIPDGIILDLMMPDIDGFQVLNIIRSKDSTRGIPILILTAKDLTDEDLRELKGNNVQQLVQKGDVPRKTLLHKVRLMLGEPPPIES